jgi:hypothetical protein
MRTTILMMMLFVATTNVKAQIFKEIFQQKQTQIEYLANQIAALKVYIGYLQKGYKIADEGLGWISYFKDGEFKLHKDYFASLKKIKPLVRDYSRIRDITGLQMLTHETYERAMAKVRSGGLFSQAEIDYMQKVYERLLDDCSNKLVELSSITTADKLEMKDDERIRRIDQIFAGMQSNYTFSQDFANRAFIMAGSRKTEVINALAVKNLLNIQ